MSRATDGPAVDPLVGLTLSGRYCIDRRIGAGGMGTVYLANNVALSQKVAVKVLHERFVKDAHLTQRFENEARTYAKLNHPNLVSVMDFGTALDGMLYMVMEYCPGTVLSGLLRESKRLPALLAADIVMQIAQGLTAAHRGGFVHRDLKPDNVMLMQSRPGRYHVKLLDFGIAKNVDDEAAGLTQAGMVFGTPEYMSPEQARGERVDGRTDLYALGTILYELLVGKPPFTGSNKVSIMHRQATETPLRPSTLLEPGELPPAIEQVALRCLEKRADDRFPDAESLIAALEDAMGGPRILAPSLPQPASTPIKTPTAHHGQVSARWTPPPERAKGNKHLVGVAIVASAFAAIVLAAILFSRPDEATSDGERLAAAMPPPEPTSRLVLPPMEVQPMEGRSGATDVRPPTTPELKAAPRPASAASRAPAASPSPASLSVKAFVRAVAEGREILQAGDFDNAERQALDLLKIVPGEPGARALRDSARRLRELMNRARASKARGDCAKALIDLETVLKEATESNRIRDLAEACRAALPPKNL